MDRAQAITRLGLLAAATSRPVLTDPELGAILDQHTRRDDDGREPQDDGWTPTWSLDAAAAEAWEVKAGRVAGDYTFSADGASYSKAEVLAHCLSMAQRYAARVHGTIRTRAELGYYDAPELLP